MERPRAASSEYSSSTRDASSLPSMRTPRSQMRTARSSSSRRAGQVGSATGGGGLGSRRSTAPILASSRQLGHHQHDRDPAFFDQQLIFGPEEQPVVDGPVLGPQHDEIVLARPGLLENGVLLRIRILDDQVGFDLGGPKDR